MAAAPSPSADATGAAAIGCHRAVAIGRQPRRRHRSPSATGRAVVAAAGRAVASGRRRAFAIGGRSADAIGCCHRAVAIGRLPRVRRRARRRTPP